MTPLENNQALIGQDALERQNALEPNLDVENNDDAIADGQDDNKAVNVELIDDNDKKDKKSVYDANNGLALYTDLEKPQEIDYSVKVELFKQSRDNFFALRYLPGASRPKVTRSAIGQLSKSVGGALYSTGQLADRQLEGIRDSIKDLPINIKKYASDIEDWAYNDVPLDVKQAIDDNYNKAQIYRKAKLEELTIKHQRELMEAGLGKDAADGILFDIGSGLTSLAAAIGLSVITKSSSSAAIFFGWLAGRGNYEELVLSGMSPHKAMAVGTASGIAEAALEKVGLDFLKKSWQLKGIAGAALGIGQEPLQEGAQAAKEEFVMQVFGDEEKTAAQTLENVFYQALIGLIVATPAHVIGSLATPSQEKLMIASIAQTLQKQGVDKKTAKETAAYIVERATSEDVVRAVDEIFNDENSPITFPNNDVKGGLEKFINVARRQIKNMTPENRKQINDIAIKAKQDFLDAGLSETEADFNAKIQRARAIFNFNFTGISPQEWYENNKVEIINEAKGAKQNDGQQNAKAYQSAAALYRNTINDISEMAEKSASEDDNKKVGYFSSSVGNKEITAFPEHIRHILKNNKHLTKEDFKILFDNIANLSFKLFDNKKYNFKGQGFKSETFKIGDNYYKAVFEVFDGEMRLRDLKKGNSKQDVEFEGRAGAAAALNPTQALNSINFNDVSPVAPDNRLLEKLKNVKGLTAQALKLFLPKKYIVKGKITNKNFFKSTVANFQTSKEPDRKPDYVSNSGSSYWYEADGVYRKSSHWGEDVATCDWFLDGKRIDAASSEFKNGHKTNAQSVGFAKWNDFVRVDKKIPFAQKDAAYDKLEDLGLFKNADGSNTLFQTSAKPIGISVEEAQRQYQEVEKKYKGTDKWLKAPNGKPSKLSERQWVMVRTPAFKKWFGDWELAGNAKMPRTAKTTSEAVNIALQQANKNPENKTLGLKASISKTNLQKMNSKSAVEKSVNPSAHALAIANIDVLFENAQFDITHSDRNNDTNIKQIHRLGALMKFGDEVLPVKITIKENADSKIGNKIYSVEAIEIEKISGEKLLERDNAEKPNLSPTADFNNKIQQLLKKVNNVSKVVDENGEPLVVYHFSRNNFSTFDISKTQDIGFHFGDIQQAADATNSELHDDITEYDVYLNIKNPLIINEDLTYWKAKEITNFIIENKKNFKFNKSQLKKITDISEQANHISSKKSAEQLNNELKSILKEAGYDGIKYLNEYEGSKKDFSFLVFEPNQIKSVDNSGTFDADNEDIRYQKENDDTDFNADQNADVRGSITFTRNGAVINLTKSHDKSTIIHELGHLFLRDIQNVWKYAQNNVLPNGKQLAALKEKVDAYLGQPDENGNYSVEQEEKFANSFTAYVKTQKAPNSAMRRLFEQFGEWLRAIKDALVETQEANLTDEIKEVFDELLAPMAAEQVSVVGEQEKAEIEQIIKDVKAGKNIEISGKKLNEIRNYLDQINRRRPKQPKGNELLKIIKSVGVKDSFPLIDLARDAGVKVLSKETAGYEQALGEDGVQQFLKDLWYLDFVDDAVRGEGTETEQARGLNILEKALKGQPVYSQDDLPAIEAMRDFDANIDALNEMFDGDLAQAEKVLRAIDDLADAHYALISLDDLETVKEVAQRIERQNKALGEGKNLGALEKEAAKEKIFFKNKSELVEKKEKELKRFAKTMKADSKKDKKKLKKLEKELTELHIYIKEYKEKVEKLEKELSDEKNIYRDIKEAIDKIAEKNRDLGKKINKKNIEDAIKTGDREKLIAAVNDALAELEREFYETADYTENEGKYKDPNNVIQEKKRVLLETAKARIKDGKDKTGFRQALRIALSGIEHFSNVKTNNPIDKKSQIMTGRERLLEKWANIKSWQELIDNIDAIFGEAANDAKFVYQKFMLEAIKKEIGRNIWVKRGNNKVGRYDAETNAFFKELQEILAADPRELEREMGGLKASIYEDNMADVDFRTRIKQLLKNILTARPQVMDKLGNASLSLLYSDLKEIRQAANDGKTLADLARKKDLLDEIDELDAAARDNVKRKGINFLTKMFLKFSGNFETYLNALFGKKYVDKYSLLRVEERADTQSYRDKMAVDERAAKIYKTDKDGFIKIYRDMLSEAWVFGDYKVNKDGKPSPVELSKADILTIYIWYKNELLRERLLMQYEKPAVDEKGKPIIPSPLNITAMFSKLTEQDKAFGDYLQETAESYYESVNEVFLRLYGITLNEVEKYFPSKAYKGDPAGDIEKLMSAAAQIAQPSQTKERVLSNRVRMKPSDPLTILKRHIDASNQYIFTQEKKNEVRKIFKSAQIENAITMAGVDIKEIGATSLVERTIEKIKSLLPVELTGKIKTRDEAIKELNKIAGKEIINKETGQKAQVNTEQRDKLVSDAAINKSVENGFTKEQHLEAVSKIDKFFENAVLLEERQDKGNDKNIKSIKRFVSAVKLGKDTDYSYILVKESVEHGNRIYTLELVNKKGLESIVGTLQERIRLSSPKDNIPQKRKVVKTEATFGQDIYDGLVNMIDKSSIAVYKQKLLNTDKALNKIVNNFLKTAVAVKPIIAIKQIAAFINYSEGIPKTDFISGVNEFILNWKAAYKFMTENSDYIKARFGAGQSNETLKRAMESAPFSEFSKWSNLLTVNIRFGDMVSVLMGGYARVKYNMARGMTKEAAFEDFELATMRTQQASIESSLSSWQSSEHPIMKLIIAFRNTPNQYARKIADAYVQFRRGEINLAQFGEVVAIYAIANPLIYAALTYGITGLFDDDDDDDDIRNILISPLTVNAGFIPLMDDAILTLTNGLIDGKIKYSGKGEILGVSDFYDWIYKGIKAFNDGDKMKFSDWLKFVDFPARAAAGVPLETIITMFSGVVDAYNWDVFRGGLKGLGYTDYRAGVIADGKYIKEKR